MNEKEAKDTILKKIVVTTQQVLLAKSIILKDCQKDTTADRCREIVLRSNDLDISKIITIHSNDNSIQILKNAADIISWSLATNEAIWSLIHSGFLIPTTKDFLNRTLPSFEFTTVLQGTGSTSGFEFNNLELPVPALMRRAPSSMISENLLLADPDLYLKELNVQNMHAEVTFALREAVKCFRHELFLAALTMLGKASEGAWSELGESLLEYIENKTSQPFTSQKDKLENPKTSIKVKIEIIYDLFKRKDIFYHLYELSEIKPDFLNEAVIWSDVVRDSRNTIHFGVLPAMPNTYEKVATMLIGAYKYLRTLYKLKGVADSNR